VAERWSGLSDLVRRLRREVERSPADLPLRERAGWVALASLHSTTNHEELANRVEARPVDAQSLQSMINLSALAILSQARPATWLCRPSASAVVHGTDLHSIPDAPPALLRAPGIVEARRPDQRGEVLWDDYASLGWYEIDGAIYLLGLRYPDGYAIARWTPRWTGGELEPELPDLDRSPLINDIDQHQAFARQAARYLIVLGLLAESEPTPLRIEVDRQERATHHVYLGERTSAPRETETADTIEGRVAEAVVVSGHLKRQRYGEARAKVKWIYVAGYAARRWFAPRWVVRKQGEPS
jgi:hypothetical protein